MTRKMVQVCGEYQQYHQWPKIPMCNYWFRLVL